MNAGISRCWRYSPLDHDAVGAGLGDRVVDVAAGAGLGGVEDPERRLVGAEVGVREHLVRGRLLEVERGRQLVVLDVDQLGGVARLGGGAGDDDGDDLAGEGDPVAGHRRVGGRDLVGGDRPGVDAGTQLLAEVGAGEHRDDVRSTAFAAATSIEVMVACANGLRTIARCSMPGQRDVVGPAGAAGDQPLVLLAATVAADLRSTASAGRSCGGGHAFAPPGRTRAARP